MVIPCVALALILLLRFGPEVPFLRVLRVAMVETPARWLSQLERRQILAVIIIAAIILAGGELILFFAPEFVALLATNLGIYLDAMAVSALLGAATVARRAIRIIRVQLGGWRTFVRRTFHPAMREVRTRPSAAKLIADNDDDPADRVPRWAA